MGRRLRSLAFSSVLLAGVALSATPALSQQDARSGPSITLGPVRVEFGSGGPTSDTVTAFIRGSIPGRVVARMYDAAIPRSGFGWQRVDFGSTPNSLEGFVEFTPVEYDYVPLGREQEFTWTINVDPAGDDRPRFGSFVVTLEPDVVPGPNEAALYTAVSIQIVAFGEETPTDLQLALDSLDVRQRKAWTTVDRLLPQIPGVIGHGPAVLEASGRNVGEAFLDERTIFEIRRVSPLTLLPGFSGSLPGPILRVSMRPRYTLPGQRFTDTTTSIIPLDNGSRVDALPLIGFVRITAIATGRLGDLEAETATLSKTVLVFPWSEFLFFFVVYLAQREWRHRKGRKVNASDSPPPPTLRTRVREVIGRIVSRFGREGVSQSTTADSKSAQAPETPDSGDMDR